MTCKPQYIVVPCTNAVVNRGAQAQDIAAVRPGPPQDVVAAPKPSGAALRAMQEQRSAALPTAGGVSGAQCRRSVRRRSRRQAALPAAGGASCAQEKGRPPGTGGRPLARNGRQRPNFSLMMSTISAPMRFCASTVEAPICGVADTRGCCSSAAFFGGSSANTSSPAP